jgi:hypothetical protein
VKLRSYAVPRCTDPASLTFEPPVTVEAASVLDAAERVLGESLSAVGRQSELAGRVLQLGDDYRTSATMVFRPPAAK